MQPFFFVGFLVEGTDNPHPGEIFPNQHIDFIQQGLQLFKNDCRFPGNQHGPAQNYRGDPNHQLSHFRVQGVGQPHPHEAQGRYWQNHLNGPGKSLLDHADICQGTGNQGTGAKLVKIGLRKGKDVVVQSIAQVPSQPGRQPGAEKTAHQRS